MPASEKQKAANRRNAQKSTGPTSAEGKLVASRNAIKHGLHACDIILKSPHLSEDRTQYEQLLDSLIDELQPQGIMQEHLVLKIANALWRYRRVINAETARINRQLETTSDHIERGLYDRYVDEPDDLEPCTSPCDCAQGDIGTARCARDPFMGDSTDRHTADILGSNSVPSESHRETLQRYEMRLDRQLTRAYRLLFQLQLAQSSKTLPILISKLENMENEPIHIG